MPGVRRRLAPIREISSRTIGVAMLAAETSTTKASQPSSARAISSPQLSPTFMPSSMKIPQPASGRRSASVRASAASVGTA